MPTLRLHISQAWILRRAAKGRNSAPLSVHPHAIGCLHYRQAKFANIPNMPGGGFSCVDCRTQMRDDAGPLAFHAPGERFLHASLESQRRTSLDVHSKICLLRNKSRRFSRLIATRLGGMCVRALAYPWDLCMPA